MDVIIGELEGSKAWEAAKSKDFEVYSAGKAAKMADIIIEITD